jgi:hypothetical protein
MNPYSLLLGRNEESFLEKLEFSTEKWVSVHRRDGIQLVRHEDPWRWVGISSSQASGESEHGFGVLTTADNRGNAQPQSISEELLSPEYEVNVGYEVKFIASS